MQTFKEKLVYSTDPEYSRLLELVIRISELVRDKGGRAFVVGGYVRDEVLSTMGNKIENKDIDLEVYGLSPETLHDILSLFGGTNMIGASFGVLKVGEIDVSLPRRDSKSGHGHTGFTVTYDPYMEYRDAARRRDFTMNSLLFDPLSGAIIDEYGGVDDIRAHIIRAVDSVLFGDDPLRALRAAQFAGRFGFTIDEKTKELCRTMPLHELSRERVTEEWFKLLLKSRTPSLGLEAMKELSILEKLHPEYYKHIAQVPHVWDRVKKFVDHSAEYIANGIVSRDPFSVLICAVCCLFDSSYLQRFLHEFVFSRDRFLSIMKLAQHVDYACKREIVSDSEILKISVSLNPATISDVEILWRAYAKTECPSRMTVVDDCINRAKLLGVMSSPVFPLVSGRDIIPLGVGAGPLLGDMLERVFEAQLDRRFFTKEEGIEYFKKYFL